MKNKVILELKKTQKYTEDCVKAMQEYINGYTDAVNEDIQFMMSKVESFDERLKAIEKHLGIKAPVKRKPKTIKTEGPANE